MRRRGWARIAVAVAALWQPACLSSPDVGPSADAEATAKDAGPGVDAASGSLSVDISVKAGADDALEDQFGVHVVYGWCSLYSTKHYAGTRFVLAVPRGAEILDAWMTIFVDSASESDPYDAIYLDSSADAAAFVGSPNELSGHVPGDVIMWTDAAIDSGWQRTPSLAGLIQGLVSRDDWREGNHIAILWHHLQNAGPILEFRQFDLLDSDGQPGRFAAKLHVAYFP